MMRNLKKISERINRLRGRRSQQIFAKQLKISQNYISQLENAKVKPSLEFLFAISELCDVSIDFILKGKDFKNKPAQIQAGFSGTNIVTLAAKEALKHLEACSKAIRVLDCQSSSKLAKAKHQLRKQN